MKEADMAFNYYDDWSTHADSDDDKFCIKDVATHEFGHTAGLDDVYYDSTKTSGEGNCPHWAAYTMHGKSDGHDAHNKESLECEDKWALWRKYGLVDP